MDRSESSGRRKGGKMEPERDYEFQVGEAYENEKGSFKVLEIDGERMVIRWESGETAETDVEFQTRIQLRRLHEQQERERVVRPEPNIRKKTARGLGGRFQGLSESDFKADVNGTHWRSREQLGGAVTRLLPVDLYRFNSWAPYRWPMIHWADERHRDPQNPSLQAKFLVKVGTESMLYGFYIERKPPDEGGAVEFGNFMSWLRSGTNHGWLLGIAMQYDLEVFDLEERFPERLTPQAPVWDL